MQVEEFLSLSNLLPDPMLLVIDKKISAANRAARNAIAVKAGLPTLINESLLELVTEPEKKVNQFLVSCAGSKDLVVGRLTFKAKNGEGTLFNCKGALLNKATEDSAAVIFLHCTPREESNTHFVLLNKKIEELNNEISKQNKAQESLRRNKGMLDGIINNTTAVIYIKDLDGRYTLVNHQFEALFGLKQPEVMGKTDFDIFPAEIARTLQNNDQLVYRSAKTLHLEEVIPHADELHTYLSNKFPLFDNEKDVYAVCGISADITRLKKAEEKIQQFNKELERRIQERTRDLEVSNKELESFSYSIAHDLRTPLRAIVSFSQILFDDASEKLDEEETGFLSRVINAGKYMTELIDDILQLSRISRAEMKMTEIDLSKLVQASIEHLHENSRTQQVTFSVQDGVCGRGDRKLLAVLLDNLVGNAYKYSSRNSAPRIEFGQCQQEGENVYFVRDNGVGFDMQYADKLFGVFQRLHTADEFEGTGIGLATAQRIVQRHGGRIWAESKPDQGASFYFVLQEKPSEVIQKLG
jgi:PAS domain S-box-containing protein